MLNNIKVLHTEWSDGWGGQEIRIINEMIALREKGVDVAIACREISKIKQKAIENEIEVFTLPFRGNTDFGTLFKLIKIIKSNNFNIINTHSGKDTWVGGIAAKISGAKFIRTRHLSNPIRSSRLNFINELADYIFTTGEVVKDDMIKNNRINPNEIKSIPTGIDADIFNPEKYKMHDTLENQINIGMVAVLRQFKRHDIFVKMAKILKDKYPNKIINFYLAGDGPQKENIINLIQKLSLEKDISMLGHIDNVPEFLNTLDIFTLTSDSKEGVPQSVMQALMMKKAVVTTDVGGTKDLLKDDNFILIQPNNIELLVDKISLLINDVNLRNNYSAKARDFVVEKFSKKTMADNIYEVYKKILS